jgi:hypothetical protein
VAVHGRSGDLARFRYVAKITLEHMSARRSPRNGSYLVEAERQ